MFKKTVHELFRCKGSRLFAILMSVNYALSCVMCNGVLATLDMDTFAD